MRERIQVDVGYIEFEALKLVPVGDRLVPERIEVTFPSTGDLPSLAMVIAVRDGVPQCTSLHIDATDESREVRSFDLSAVRIEDWIEELTGLASWKVEPSPGYVTGQGHPTVSRTHGGPAGAADERAGRSAVRNARRAARRTVTPHLLEAVTKVYRENIDNKPTDAVQGAFAVSYRTAGRYVQLARSAGLLPPTTPGKKEA